MKFENYYPVDEGWNRCASWMMQVGAWLAPVLLFAGFSSRPGGGNFYLAAVSNDVYSLAAALSWLPIVLLGWLVDCLRFNRQWLREKLTLKRSEFLTGPLQFVGEVVILLAALACVVATGAELAQVWEARWGTQALVMCGSLLCVLVVLYGYVVSAPSDSGLGNRVGTDKLTATTDSTEVLQPSQNRVYGDATYEFEWWQPRSGFDQLAGMKSLKDELRAAMKPFELYSSMSAAAAASGSVAISDRNGILLSGPPGNGKTVFAKAIAAELNLPIVKIGCADITSKWINQGPAMVKELFRQAAKQPCVVFLDEFDGVAWSRTSSQMHAEDRKLVNTLLTEIDNARSKMIVLVAATNFVERLDAAVCRDGRFDYRIEIGFPDQEARKGVICALLEKHRLIADVRDVDRISRLWQKRSMAFIESALKRVKVSVTDREGFRAFYEDFRAAGRAASRKESAIPGVGPKLSELMLPKKLKAYAQNLVFRLNNWEENSSNSGDAPSGILLYGPPGTGKSLFVNALARELKDWHLMEVNAREISNDPAAFRRVMELAQTHRPSIVFIDEADELLGHRTISNNAPATNELLKALDGASGRTPEVLFVAATNQFDAIDPAALRGGRFSEHVYMDLLRGTELQEFWAHQLQNLGKLRIASDVTAHALVHLSGEAAPANIVSWLRSAVALSAREKGTSPKLGMTHFYRTKMP
jgi:transitional endoplasmic reticulum ATPase